MNNQADKKNFDSILQEIQRTVQPKYAYFFNQRKTIMVVKNEDSVLFLINCIRAKYRDRIKITVSDLVRSDGCKHVVVTDISP